MTEEIDLMGVLENWIRRSVSGDEQQVRQSQRRRESALLLAEARNLDDRLAKAEALAEKTRFEFERALSFLPAMFIMKDLTGTLLQVNRYVSRGFGTTPEAMVGKNQDEFWPADQCASFALDDAEVVASREGKFKYLECIEYSHEVRWFRTWKMPVFNGGPDPIGVMSFSIDLCEVCPHLQDGCPGCLVPGVTHSVDGGGVSR